MTIVQIILLLTIIFIGSFLERLDRKSPKLFGGLIFMLMLAFISLDKNSAIHNHTTNTDSFYTERMVSEIRGGSDPTNSRTGFVGGKTGPGKTTNPKSTETGPKTNPGYGHDKGWPKPRFPWGVNPNYPRSGSSDVSDPHELSAARDWIRDPSAWEDDERDHPLEVPVDFPYRLNEKNEPTLLVPNPSSTKSGKPIRIEFDQTATHLHHASEFGISLPNNFDMAYYQSLTRSGKIAYAKAMVPNSTITSYQNEIGKQLTPVFNPNTSSLAGIAGQNQIPTQVIIAKPRDLYPSPGQGQPIQIGQQIQTPPPSGKKNIMLGIVTNDGLHISSYPISQDRLDRLEAENYWVLKNQNIP